MSLESDYSEFVADVNAALASIEKKLNTPVVDLSNELSHIRSVLGSFGSTVTAAPAPVEPAPTPTREPVPVEPAPVETPTTPDVPAPVADTPSATP